MKIKNEILVIQCYEECKNIAETARRFLVSSDTIRRILKRNNVKLLGNIGGAKKFNINYFDDVNTYNKAYFLGLLYADGSIRRTKDADSWRVYLGLVGEDRYLIQKFKEEIESEHVIWSYVCSSGNYMYKLAVRNKHFGENLINKGLVPTKSKSSIFPVFLEDSLVGVF